MLLTDIRNRSHCWQQSGPGLVSMSPHTSNKEVNHSVRSIRTREKKEEKCFDVICERTCAGREP